MSMLPLEVCTDSGYRPACCRGRLFLPLLRPLSMAQSACFPGTVPRMLPLEVRSRMERVFSPVRKLLPGDQRRAVPDQGK